MRRTLDFYETAPWQTRALLSHHPVAGVILEPCVGDGSIARILADELPSSTLLTNDIDEMRAATFYVDAASAELYRLAGGVDWVISNPPYGMPLCTRIVEQAVRQARVGVAMMLRISFLEPTAKVNPRGPFLAEYPPNRLLILPRHSFTGNGKTDSTTTEWVIWDQRPLGLPPILPLHRADEQFANGSSVAHWEDRTMATTSMTALEQVRHLTAGISGDELIRRRRESVCVACGLMPVYIRKGEQPWLCVTCAAQVPAKPSFDYKQHKEDGIRNLQRLESDQERD